MGFKQQVSELDELTADQNADLQIIKLTAAEFRIEQILTIWDKLSRFRRKVRAAWKLEVCRAAISQRVFRPKLSFLNSPPCVLNP